MHSNPFGVTDLIKFTIHNYALNIISDDNGNEYKKKLYFPFSTCTRAVVKRNEK